MWKGVDMAYKTNKSFARSTALFTVLLMSMTLIATPLTSCLPSGEKVVSPDYAMHVFLWGNAPTTDRDLKLVKDAGFRWVKQRFEWRYIEGNGKGQFEWNEPDRIVDAADRAGLQVIARLDNQPKWSRSDNI